MIEKIAHSYDAGSVKKKADCETDGLKVYTCGSCGGTKNETIAKLGHNYSEPTFKWSSDFSECIAVFTCRRSDDTQEIACSIRSEEKPATGTEAGEICYTATVTFGDNEYSETSKKILQPVIEIPVAVTNLKSVSAGKNRVKLTWTASEGAEGYLIYAQKAGKYGYVGMTTKGTSYTDTKALDTDYNFYWVFPYVKDANGKMYAGGCTKYVYAKGICPAVTKLKASSVTDGVKLTWTATAGAEGYLVYGIENGGSYGYVGMTKGTTYTAKKASKTVYNYYWIFPYHKDVNGKMITGGVAPYTYGRAK